MKVSRLIFRIIVFVIIGIVVNIFADWVLAESKRDWIKAGRYYPKIQFKEFYQLPDNSLDLVMIGSSLCYYGIDPFIIRKKTGLTCFNLGTPRQPLSATYYLLKEMYDYQKPEYIILELHYEILTRTYLQLYKTYVLNNIKISFNKINLFLKGFSTKEKIHCFLPLLQDHNAIKYIFNKITNNQENPFAGREEYIGLGYVRSYEKIDRQKNGYIDYEWDEKAITPEVRYYYPRIVKLIEDHNSQLIVINFPYSELVEIKNSKEFWHNYRKFVQIEDNIIIFNYLNSDMEFPLADFFDLHHFNSNGSQKITNSISDSLNHIMLHR